MQIGNEPSYRDLYVDYTLHSMRLHSMLASETDHTTRLSIVASIAECNRMLDNLIELAEADGCCVNDE
jgi:hypothetical protein